MTGRPKRTPPERPEPKRCWTTTDPLYNAYHDEEWGRPVRDERALLERLCLEGFQSGLSWLTILRKRESFRAAFAGFDTETVAAFGARDMKRLLADASIVRHRGKIEAAIANARATLAVQDEIGSLAALIWSYEPEPRPPAAEMTDLPTTMAEATTLAKDLRKRSFRFVGPTTV